MVTASSESGCSLTAILNSLSAFSQVVIQAVKAVPQKQVIVYIVGFKLYDFFVLLDG